MFSLSTHTHSHTRTDTHSHTHRGTRRSHNLHDESRKLLPNRLGRCRCTNCHQIIDICRRFSSPSLVPFALCSTPSLSFLALSQALDYVSRTIKAPPSRRHNRVPGMHCSVHCLAMKLLNCCRAHCTHTHTPAQKLSYYGFSCLATELAIV